MKNTKTFQLLVALVLVIGATFSLSAQEASDENRKATIKIVKEIDGKMTTIDRMIELQNGESLQDALKRTGLDQEMEGVGIDAEDMDIDVDIEIEEDGNHARKMKKMIFIGEDGEMGEMDLMEGNHFNFDTEDGSEIEVIEKNGKQVITIKRKGGEEKVIEIQGDKIKVNGDSENVMIFKKGEKCCKEGDWANCCSKMMKKAHHNTNKASLGVMLTQEIENENGVETNSGMVIEEVMKESAAEAAGLQKGDVLKKIDGNEVGNYEEIIKALSAFNVGDKVKIGYERNGKKATAKAILKANTAISKKAFKSCEKSSAVEYCHSQKMRGHQNKASLGVMVTQQVENENGVETNSGVVIQDVMKESAAEAAGLQEGDLIIAIDEKQIDDYKQVVEAIGQYEPGDQIKISYERDGKKASTLATLKGYGHDKTKVIIKKYQNGEDIDIEKIIEEIDIEGKNLNVWIKDMETADVEKIENASLKKAAAENSLTVESLQFYPNPSDGRFDLSFNLPEKGKTIVRVVDMAGKEVFQDRLGDFSGMYEKQIDISDNAKGIYFLQVEQNEKVMMKKIIVQ